MSDEQTGVDEVDQLRPKVIAAQSDAEHDAHMGRLISDVVDDFVNSLAVLADDWREIVGHPLDRHDRIALGRLILSHDYATVRRAIYVLAGRAGFTHAQDEDDQCHVDLTVESLVELLKTWRDDDRHLVELGGLT